MADTSDSLFNALQLNDPSEANPKGPLEIHTLVLHNRHMYHAFRR